jgi:hypothetical protein
LDKVDILDTLDRIIRRELAECERAIRDQDPVRALNDLADAVRALKSLRRNIDTPTDE